MRIGLIAPPWLPVPPPKYGGTEAVVDRLARGFAERRHEVTLFCTGDSTCPVPKAWAFERAERDNLGQVASELRHVIAAYDMLADCDIVHDHTVVGPMYAERFRRLKVVTTVHNAFADGWEDVYRATAAHTPVIAISHHQASMAGPIPIAAVIHHGVDPDEFRVGPGGGYFCWVGRMAPYKGPREAALIARRTGVPLLMAAKAPKGEELEYFRDQVEPLLGGDVEYLGEIERPERDTLFGGAIALLNPISWPEPFGLVMVESFACGTPVVAFRSGAAPEIVEDGVTGLLCGDVDDMADRLPEVDRLDRTACRKIVETYFSSNRMVTQHLALYEDLISCGRATPTPEAYPHE